MDKLDGIELQAAVADLPHWTSTDGSLTRELHFPNFVIAMECVNRIAQIAEKEGHHPDIDIRYNVVRLGLVTHDAGGITTKDIEMATRLNRELDS